MNLRPLSLALCLALAATGAASAQSVRLLGDFRDWSSYAAIGRRRRGVLCHDHAQGSRPRRPTAIPKAISTSPTARPKTSPTSSTSSPASPSSPTAPPPLTVGGQSFTLFTQNDAAWLDDAGQSDALASAIRAGSSLVIEGTSAAGIKITQSFSLSGATAASQAIGGEC